MFVIQQGGSRSNQLRESPRPLQPTKPNAKSLIQKVRPNPTSLVRKYLPVSYKHIQKKRRPPIHIRLVRSFVCGCHGSLPVHFRSLGDATTS